MAESSRPGERETLNSTTVPTMTDDYALGSRAQAHLKLRSIHKAGETSQFYILSTPLFNLHSFFAQYQSQQQQQLQNHWWQTSQPEKKKLNSVWTRPNNICLHNVS